MLPSDANVTLDEYIGCENSYGNLTFGHGVRATSSQVPSPGLAFIGSTIPGIPEATPPGVFVDYNLTGDRSMMPTSILSKCGNSSLSSPFGCMNYENSQWDKSSMVVDSAGEYCQMIMQSSERTQQVFEGTVQWDGQANDSAQNYLYQCWQSETEAQPYSYWKHIPHMIFDGHYLKQQQQQQQPPLEDSLGLVSAEGNLTEPQMRSITQYQMQLKSQTMQDVSQEPKPLLMESTSDPYLASGRSTFSCGSNNASGERELSTGQRFLLIYMHVETCSVQETECQFSGCSSMKQIRDHLCSCNGIGCGEFCSRFLQVFEHYRQCSDAQCSFCLPVLTKTGQLCNNNVLKNSDNITMRMHGAGVSVQKAATFPTGVDLQSRPKEYMRLEHPPVPNLNKINTSHQVPKPAIDDTHLSSKGHLQQTKTSVYLQKQTQKCMRLEHPSVPNLNKTNTSLQVPKPTVDDTHPSSEGHLQQTKTHVDLQNQRQNYLKLGNSSVSNLQKTKTSQQVPKPTVDGTSLFSTGYLDAHQQMKTLVTPLGMVVKPEVEHHAGSSGNIFARPIVSTELAIAQEPDVKSIAQEEISSQSFKESILVPTNADKVELGMSSKDGVLSVASATTTNLGQQVMKGASLIASFTPQQVSQHIASLKQCVKQGKEKDAAVDQTPCDLCGMAQLSFETPRYCSICGKLIEYHTFYYSKISSDTGNGVDMCIRCCKDPTEYKRTKNIGAGEDWVKCHNCKSRQHEICALFNKKINQGEQAEYTCPRCLLQENEGGEQKSLPRNTALGAENLPSTLLSNHIEEWLFRRLKQEREERAKGKKFDEVQGAEGLSVRVVSSVNKKLEVGKLFHGILQEKDYPAEFCYKSKAILLFQKIEGADVCLFAMYVQEFGSDCAYPNQRRICLSYIDSVKYFSPDIKAVTGEALRTFVYHEILIGYLDYCKKRGYTSFYIWVCPPVKGDDYILNCHPKIQKTPNNNKLRKWYLSMIHKAQKAKIVVDHNNLYDQFFVPTGECKVKISASHLPYFDSDYWPGQAEKLLNPDNGHVHNQEKNASAERRLRHARRVYMQGNLESVLLMHHLEQSVHPMKEDFIMIHLQYACNHCCRYILSGTRWVCEVCKKFQLCNKCYDIERSLAMEHRHPTGDEKMHSFCEVEVENVPDVTDDKDGHLQNDYFDTRDAFLRLCERNKYQFDTLRRAKHSTMMILYHLHNPVCHNKIEMTLGGGEHDVRKKRGTQKKLLSKEPSMSDILFHASRCFTRGCDYKFCRKIRSLFHHSKECQTRVDGGCHLCKIIWYILKLHAKACKLGDCYVPRCRELKHHMAERNLKSKDHQKAGMNRKRRKRPGD